MSKANDRLEEYALFYEEIGRRSERTLDKPKSEELGIGGLTEEQLTRLSDDLRSPIKDDPSTSNPLQ